MTKAWHGSRATDSTGFGVESVRLDQRSKHTPRVDRTPKREPTGSSPPPSPTNR